MSRSIPISEASRLRDAIQSGGVDEYDLASIMEYGYEGWLAESESFFATEERAQV